MKSIGKWSLMKGNLKRQIDVLKPNTYFIMSEDDIAKDRKEARKQALEEFFEVHREYSWSAVRNWIEAKLKEVEK